VWSCDSCGANVKSSVLCPICGAGQPGVDGAHLEMALRRDLIMEAHLGALAIWYRVGAVLGVVGALAIVVGLGAAASGLRNLDGGGAWGTGGALFAGALGWMAMLMVAVSAGSYVMGHYLARYVNAARVAAGVIAVLGLVLTVVRTGFTIYVVERAYDLYGGGRYGYGGPSLGGIIFWALVTIMWSIAVTWALLSRRSATVCTPEYRTIVARTRELKAPTFKSPFFVLPLVACSFVVLATLILISRF
jgi:hypothetical protein